MVNLTIECGIWLYNQVFTSWFQKFKPTFKQYFDISLLALQDLVFKSHNLEFLER